MKKITTLLLLLFTILTLSGCGNKDKIDRLVKTAERESNRAEQYKADVDILKTENLELQAEIDNLKIQLSEKDTTIKDLSEQLESNDTTTQNLVKYEVNYSQSSSYLAMKFWIDGSRYSTSDTIWYSDCFCSNKITNSVTIVSPIVDKSELSNGYTVYSCMSSNGLVYTSSYPYLIKTD